MWANHHTMFHYIHRSDQVLLVCNLLLLLCMALLPFTTAALHPLDHLGRGFRRRADSIHQSDLRPIARE
jgi:uncharacterized membrane protein